MVSIGGMSTWDIGSSRHCYPWDGSGQLKNPGESVDQ
jgi:hypothetical protein